MKGQPNNGNEVEREDFALYLIPYTSMKCRPDLIRYKLFARYQMHTYFSDLIFCSRSIYQRKTSQEY